MLRSLVVSLCLIATLFATTPQLANANSDYLCIINRVVTAEPPPNSQLTIYEKSFLGEQFTVNRHSGVMAGSLKNSYLTKPQVIDRGSKDNSFKVVTTLRREQGIGASSNIYTLVINEFVPTKQKPFVFTNNDMVFLGSCQSDK